MAIKTKIIRFIIIPVLIGSCVQAAVNMAEAFAAQGPSKDKDIREIRKVWEKVLTAFANRDIDSAMELVSPDYSKKTDSETINYDGYRKLAEANDADFFSKRISCHLENLKILKSDITDNRAVVDFDYTFRAFDKNSMRWISYRAAQEVTFFRENDKWKIISTGDKRYL